MAAVLGATGHDPIRTYFGWGQNDAGLFYAGFFAHGALSSSLISATPLLFTGLAAAAAFRMQLFNIGAEGQLYLGAIGGSWIALKLGAHGVHSTALLILAMCVAGRGAGAVWALIPGLLRAVGGANGIP